ncbi:hypothetical protein DERP_012947 [Dermatophagoides pteronyssinus]|uniref:Uncharacterized protein n=1 Tax=Dermatophagoides pteronyssinus TaxID=6956 RepID=A0ABQ8J3S0_DERPT|nr:hypothetical protein DERP_012947 [Dermatophagoides pteronyssinus]
MLNLAENFFDLINWKKITDYTVKTDESQASKNIFMIIVSFNFIVQNFQSNKEPNFGRQEKK